jgi:HEPN domain-containing protein
VAKETRKTEAGGYLGQAREFLESAIDNMNNGRFNAAGFDATQSIINANDALTAHFLGMRASADHMEAVRLHVDVVRVISDSSCRGILKNALDMRSAVGYLGKPVSRSEAESLTRDAARFLEWTKKYVK